MQYKILLIRNRITDKFDFARGLDWFKANTTLEIVTEEMTTDFDITTKSISNATYHGVICGDDIYDKLRTVVPEGKYHAVVFIPGNDLNGIRVNYSGIPLYLGTDVVQLFQLHDGGKTLNHELFHTFLHRLLRQGIIIDDPMDMVVIDNIAHPYYNDFDMSAVPSNRSIALDRITPYWDKICNIIINTPQTLPQVVLTRNIDNGIETLGTLSVGNFVCKTLERPYKNNQTNISCIPAGLYTVQWTFSWRMVKYTYEVIGVPNRSGIRIHSANYFFDLKGCIALGSGYSDLNKDGQVDVINSRVTVKAFEDLMQRQTFTLQIK